MRRAAQAAAAGNRRQLGSPAPNLGTPASIQSRSVANLSGSLPILISELDNLPDGEWSGEISDCFHAIGLAQEVMHGSPGCPTEFAELVASLKTIHTGLGAMAETMRKSVNLPGAQGQVAELLFEFATAARDDVQNRIDQLNPPAARMQASPLSQSTEALHKALTPIINDLEKLSSEAAKTSDGALRTQVDSMKAGLDALATGYEALGKAPAGYADMTAHLDVLGNARNQLGRLSQELGAMTRQGGSAAGVAGKLDALVRNAQSTLSAREAELREAVNLNPLSAKAVYHSKSFSVQGAIKVIDEQIEKLRRESHPAGGGQAAQSLRTLENAKDVLQARYAQMEAVDDLKPLTKDQIQNLMGSKGPDKGIVCNQRELAGVKSQVQSVVSEMRRIEPGNPAPAGANQSARPSPVASPRPIASQSLGQATSHSAAQPAIQSANQSANQRAGLAAGKGATPRAGEAARALPLSQPAMREEGVLELLLGEVFHEAGLEEPKNLRDRLQDGRMAALNEQPWKTIDKSVRTQVGASSFVMKAKIQPQSQIAGQFADMNGGGVVCHMAQAYKHPTTLAVSTLEAPNGQKIFEGMRHGVISAYDISASKFEKMEPEKLETLVKDLLPEELWVKDKDSAAPSLEKTLALLLGRGRKSKAARRKMARAMRARANLMRATDVAKTALVKNSAKLGRALKGEVVTINLNTIGLLTPDKFRSLTSRGESCGMNERLMLEEQMQAWAALGGDPQPRTITVSDENGKERQVKVRVEVNAFNFGVNALSFGVKGITKPSHEFFSGWEKSDRYNSRAMASLIGSQEDRANGGFGGRLGAWLAAPPKDASPRTIETVRELGRQIAGMWDDKSYRRAGREPYKMVSRLALLSSMMGDDVSWNCKSGKDRTGECDVEARHLASEVWLSGKVPTPDHLRSEAERANFFRMAVDGGNFELQNYNTGAPGFKLGGVPALSEAMATSPNDDRYRYFKGIAGFYGS